MVGGLVCVSGGWGESAAERTERCRLALPKSLRGGSILKGGAAHHAPEQRIPPPHAALRSHLLLRGAEASCSIQ